MATVTTKQQPPAPPSNLPVPSPGLDTGTSTPTGPGQAPALREEGPRPEALERKDREERQVIQEDKPTPSVDEVKGRLAALSKDTGHRGHAAWAKYSEETEGTTREVAYFLAFSVNTGLVPPATAGQIAGSSAQQLADALSEAVNEGVTQPTAPAFLARRFPGV